MSHVSGDNQRLTEAMERYLEALESGEPLDRDTFLAENSDIAAELSEQLTSLELLFQVGSELKSGAHPSRPAEKEGQALGDFRLLQPIGRGGMGVVYEAEQISLGRRVAVKILPLANMLDSDQLKRFRNEARTAATLDHPNIVPVYFVGQERGVHFYAMQLIVGNSLADVIRDMAADDALMSDVSLTKNETAALANADLSTRRSKQPTKFFHTVADMGIQAANALEHAHRVGVVHRDIKPGNLLLDCNGKLWVTDFGLASWEHNESLTRTGGIVGTVAYMSPEQAAGSRMIDLRTDIYSLGATLYELILLNKPGNGAATQPWPKPAAEPRMITSLRSHDPRVPVDLETIVLKALAEDPEDRYQTAGELADDLKRFAEDRPIKARRMSWSDRSLRWLRRRTGTVATVGTAALLLLSITIAALAFHTRSLANYADQIEDALSEKEIALEKANAANATARQARQRAEQSEQHARELGYRSDMQLAYERHQAGDYAATNRLASRQIPVGSETDVRGLEWDLLRSQLDVEIIELARHAGPATECALFPDGIRAASVGEDGMVHIFDLQTRGLLKSYAPGIGPIYAVQISPDGKTIAIGGEPSLKTLDLARIYFLDADTGERIGSMHRHQTSIESIAYSPDGTVIASGARYQDIQVSTTAGEYLGSFPAMRRNESILFTADGARIISLQDRSILQYFDLETRSIDRTLQLAEGVGSVSQFAASPDGQFLITTRNSYPNAYEVEAVDGTLSRTLTPKLPYPRQFSAITHQANTNVVACGDTDGKVHLFDRRSNRPFRSATVLEGRVTDIKIDSAGQILATGDDGSVVFLSLNQNAIERRPLTFHVTAGVLADDQLFVGTDSGEVRRLNALQNEPSKLVGRVSERPLVDLSISTAGGLMATVDETGRVVVSDLDGKRLWIPREGGTIGIQRVALSPDGSHLAHTGQDELFTLWHVPSREAITARKFPRRGSALGFSADGKTIACGADRVRWFDVESGTLLEQFAGGGATYDLAFSPNGDYLASAHWDGMVRLHHLEERTTRILKGHRHFVRSVAFSADGQSLLSIDAGQFDDSLRIWNVSLGEPFGAFANPMLPAHTQSPEGKLLLNRHHLVMFDPSAPQPALFHFPLSPTTSKGN